MFLRLVSDSFARRPRHKFLTGAALALGMGVATAALSVSLDVGDRLAKEFRSLGANLLVTPQADSLPLEIGGVDYRPVNAGAYLPEADLPKLKTIFWRNNIMAFAPVLEVPAKASLDAVYKLKSDERIPTETTTLVGMWSQHSVAVPDGSSFVTGVQKTNPWWSVEGRWFTEGASECLLGKRFAMRTGEPIGGTISVHVGSQSLSLKVTGVVSTGSVEDDFARRDPKTMNAGEFERWSCSPYVSSIAYSIKQVLAGTDVRVIRRVAEGEGQILTRVRMLLWLVTGAALLAAALAVGASSAASVIERRTEIGLMKALGAGSGTVGFLLAAEQLLLAFVGGGAGYALGILLARLVGEKIFGVAPEPSLLVFFVIIALAAGVTILGSAFPLRRASRYEPAPILRGE